MKKRFMMGVALMISAAAGTRMAGATVTRTAPASDPEVLCQAIHIESSRDLCYISYAVSRQEADWCLKVQNAQEQANCLRQVRPPQDVLTLWPLSSDPDALRVDETAPVRFTTMQTGSEERPQRLTLEEVNAQGKTTKVWGELHDDGRDGDLGGGDFVYTGTFVLPAGPEAERRFQARGLFKDGERMTDIYRLPVTRFPVGTAVTHMDHLILDPDGNKVLADEILVGFQDGVAPERIEAVIQEAGGTLIGTIMTLRVYQIRIPAAKDYAALEAVIRRFQGYPEVEYAEPNGVTGVDSVPVPGEGN